MSSSNLSIATVTSKNKAAGHAAHGHDAGANPAPPADEVVVEDAAPQEGVVKDAPAGE